MTNRASEVEFNTPGKSRNRLGRRSFFYIFFENKRFTPQSYVFFSNFFFALFHLFSRFLNLF